ncbi:DUF4238 domain-containing protein [Pedobacter panaciterrae]|uniref:DUF4238 domain-containing protein n=1 Tax=Pedobacter panaciterrae TaxID=363849 RepID=UPI00259858F5|nr:DUF4238 domain-containing protein [uncultured Pedobacter sp.]
MASRKSHHYVPQFYLRKFSLGEEGKTIGLYNHVKDLYVPTTSIKHQACQKYLYGKDDYVEDILSKLESTIAIMFGRMIKHFLPPADDSPAYKVLLRYILYQESRTTKAGDDLLQAINKSLKTVFDNVYGPENIMTGYTASHEEATLLMLEKAEENLYLLDFLTCKLMVNLSTLPLITSDAPVIKYNQYLETKNMKIGAHGFPAKGLQIFLPIHPRMMICLYDPAVYSCGKDEQYCVTTESEEEVHQFNVLQYLNSNTQLYFGADISENYVRFIHDNFSEKKSELGPYSEYIETPDKRKFILNAQVDPYIDLETSFFTIKPSAMDLIYQGNLAPLRDESFYDERKAQGI